MYIKRNNSEREKEVGSGTIEKGRVTREKGDCMYKRVGDRCKRKGDMSKIEVKKYKREGDWCQRERVRFRCKREGDVYQKQKQRKGEKGTGAR